MENKSDSIEINKSDVNVSDTVIAAKKYMKRTGEPLFDVLDTFKLSRSEYDKFKNIE